MEVTKKLIPGQPGTKRYLRQYGEQLFCVRYRKDKETLKTVTTVEIVVDERMPAAKAQPAPKERRVIYLKHHDDNPYYQQLLNTIGGEWVEDKGVWKALYEKAIQAGLQDDIIEATT